MMVNDLVSELSAFIETRLADVHTGMPAEVVSFNAETATATVQPLLKRTYVDAAGVRTVVLLPQIQGAPVQYPHGGGCSITWPLVPGERVWLSFAERSLDRWLASQDGAAVSPNDPRKHNLSDAIVMAGVDPTALRRPVDPSALVIRRELGEGETGPHAEVRLQPDGQVLLGEGATLGVAREGDGIEISRTTAPAFFTFLDAVASSGPATVPPFQGTIAGRITSASERIKAT